MGKQKTIEQQYIKLSPIEHVLKRPDTYVGSCLPEKTQQWVWDENEDKMVFRHVEYSPALYKIFDEILVNAADVKSRQENEARKHRHKISRIDVDIMREAGTIRIKNDGDGIPVQIHKEHGCYVPELIFGQLLTSDNYDDEEERVTGGRNGYGAKLTNIFSTKFTVEVGDAASGRAFSCTWTNNMNDKGKVDIQPYERSKDYVSVTFKPMMELFGGADEGGFSDDLCAIFSKRTYDVAGTVGVSVYLNGTKIPVTCFSDYCDLYFPNRGQPHEVETWDGGTRSDSMSDFESDLSGAQNVKKEGSKVADSATILGASGLPILKVYDKQKRWEVIISQSETSVFQQVSFVNNIATIKGGSHVKSVTDQILALIMKEVNKKNKGGMALTANMALQHMWIFVNALVVNPIFDGQTKERLKQDPKTFGSNYILPPSISKKIIKSPLMEALLLWVQTKQQIDVNRKLNAAGRAGARKTIIGIPKLEDANDAGTKNSQHCTLIVTEGDSAKASCMAGLSVVGRNRYGVFPLRGKVLNVRDAKHEQLTANAELANVIKILGLRMGNKDQTASELRYGRLMIMTDQDPDGCHIKGLLINLFDVFWPKLLKSNSFILDFVTPLVKVSKGREVRSYYTMSEYRAWRINAGNGWKVKYYKGLGTSTDAEFKSYFSAMDEHVKTFTYVDAEDSNAIDLAFNKDRPADRKVWMQAFNPETDVVNHSDTHVRYKDFINKDLIHFSRYDLARSVACVVDGLKPGMRKVVFSAIKRKLWSNDVKITQLCGYVLEYAAYHHGDAALQDTIVKLAQRFTGSNNVAVFEPIGQFGSRVGGGKDASAARYISTRMSNPSRQLFKAEDEAILDPQLDDGMPIEPLFYVPVVPTVLMNGTEGIGTGWSSSVPSYKPDDLISNIRRWIVGEPMEPMTPWYKGFKGEVRRTEKGFETVGTVVRHKEPSVDRPWGVLKVSELPVKYWTSQFKEFLETLRVENQASGDTAVPASAAKAKSKAKAKAKAKGKSGAAVAKVRRSCAVVIQDYMDHSTHEAVEFDLLIDEDTWDRMAGFDLYKELGLTRPIAMSNLTLFDSTGHIVKYENEIAILRDFCDVRMAYYIRRKKAMVAMLEREHCIVMNKARFVRSVVDNELRIQRKKKAVLVLEMKELEYVPMDQIDVLYDRKMAEIVPGYRTARLDRNQDGELEEDAEVEVEGSVTSFNYMLNLPMVSMTLERVEALEQELRIKENEIFELKGTSEKTLWDRDILSFEQSLQAQAEVDAKVSKDEAVFNRKRRDSIEPVNVKKFQRAAVKVKGVKSEAAAPIKAAPKRAAVNKARSKAVDKKPEVGMSLSERLASRMTADDSDVPTVGELLKSDEEAPRKRKAPLASPPSRPRAKRMLKALETSEEEEEEELNLYSDSSVDDNFSESE